jgi:prepilin-type N-terminal cleavage/methylation domain-containing protein/prepilin-type processing-associated H-X9-DG protein
LVALRISWPIKFNAKRDAKALRSGAGFTLIELLVVVAIIAILASMVLPALARAKAMSTAATCLNNLKQWGVATQMYALENEDFLPPDGSVTGNSTNNAWYIDLPKTLGIAPCTEMPWYSDSSASLGKSIWICPSNPRVSVQTSHMLFHYCLNENINGTGKASRSVRLSSISRPSKAVWLFDSKNQPPCGSVNFVGTNTHNEAAQMVFLDGHASRINRRAVWNFTNKKWITNGPSVVFKPDQPTDQ